MKKTIFACGLVMAAAALAVEPEVKSSSVTLKGTCTAAEAAAARAKFDAAKVNPKWARVTVENGDDAAVAALAAAFPECHTFVIEHTGVTTLAPLAALKVKEIDLRYCALDDLAPLGANATVEKVNLYGSAVKDFSPLARCAKLKEVNYYATKAEPAVYQTLGALKQCTTFAGGLSGITSLDWVRDVPEVETLEVFSEQIADFSPVASAKNLKRFRAWNMNNAKLGGKGLIPAVGDLAFLAACTKLEKLELPGSAYSNLAALSGLTSLKSIELTSAENPVDLSFAKGLLNLENLFVTGRTAKNPVKVTGLESLADLPKLSALNLQNTAGYALSALRPTKSLRVVTLPKGVFPEAEVKALETAMKAVNPRARVNLR